MPEAAPAPNTSLPTLEPIFKCPKCNKYHMCLRQKRDNNGFFFTCLGKPECTHVIWLADVIKEVKIHDDCNKCRNGNKKLVIKFKTNNLLAMLNASLINDEDRTYCSCILCDSSLRIILDINAISLRGASNSPSNQSQTVNRTIPTQNAPRINPNTNQRSQNVRPPSNTRPTMPQNPNSNQSFRNSGNTGNTGNTGNVRCSGCNQPAQK